MAYYIPNTWVSRQGTGLNRFVDQEGNALFLTSAPTEIVTEGTPFSADWMNHIEQGVADTSEAVTRANLLHNWDFRSPVNQRGGSTYSASGAERYSIDRWIIAAGQVNIHSGYLTLTPAANGEALFYQRMENGAALVGETVTMSVEIAGTVYGAQFVVPESGHIVKNVTDNVRLDINYTAGYLSFGIRADAVMSFTRAKVELGTVSTLENDGPMDRQAQTLICLRYFYRRNTPVAVYCNFVDGTFSVHVCLVSEYPVSMRTVPTITFDGPYLRNWKDSTDTDITFTINTVRNDGIYSVNGGTQTCVQGTLYLLPSYDASADL